MDFHWSDSHAVKNFDDALRLPAKGFHAMVRENVDWVAWVESAQFPEARPKKRAEGIR